MTQATQYTGRFLLLFLMVGKMLAMPLALLDYKMNTAFIAETLCENKAVPEMQCNGKCYLKKQMEKSNDAPESGSEKGDVVKSVSVEFIQEIVSYHIPSYCEGDAIPYFSSYINAVVDGCHNSVFRPPVRAFA